MKLNIDCIREILLIMEDMPRNESLSGAELREILSEFSADDVDYSCLKLKEAGYIEATIKVIPEEFFVLQLKDITFSGHQFIADIRTQTVWNETKSICEKVGSFSISAIMQIASGVVTSFINQQLGIT